MSLELTKEFKAIPGSRLTDKEAAIVGPKLEELAATGEVTAERVLQDAQDPSSVLHSHFTWDDNEAARKCRLDEARQLVRSVAVVIKNGGVEAATRAFHVVHLEGNKQYVPSSTVFSREELASQVVEKARQELESWRKRYGQYSELAGLVAFVDQALGK